jgi:hypothetical protein
MNKDLSKEQGWCVFVVLRNWFARCHFGCGHQTCLYELNYIINDFAYRPKNVAVQ